MSVTCKDGLRADYLYNAGYCKIPEGAVVLTNEEYRDLQISQDFDYGYHNGESNMTAYYENIRLPEVRKETAEKFAERLKEKFPINEDVFRFSVPEQIHKVIDEICKDITEGKV